MVQNIEISHCRCGRRGILCKQVDNNDVKYFIECNCGNKTSLNNHIETTINEWNELNKPKKAKVKYKCGNCGEEVMLGFDMCTKCGTEIEW